LDLHRDADVGGYRFRAGKERIREQALLPEFESGALFEKQLALPTPYAVALSRFSGGDAPSLEPVVS
jgi:hypothetical protein